MRRAWGAQALRVLKQDLGQWLHPLASCAQGLHSPVLPRQGDERQGGKAVSRNCRPVHSLAVYFPADWHLPCMSQLPHSVNSVATDSLR